MNDIATLNDAERKSLVNLEVKNSLAEKSGSGLSLYTTTVVLSISKDIAQ